MGARRTGGCGQGWDVGVGGCRLTMPPPQPSPASRERE
ncbi:hypothetical protein [Azospirillum largimobile]